MVVSVDAPFILIKNFHGSWLTLWGAFDLQHLVVRHVLRHEVWGVSGCPEGNIHRGRIQDVPQLNMLQLVAAICLSKVSGLLLSHI